MEHNLKIVAEKRKLARYLEKTNMTGFPREMILQHIDKSYFN